MQITMLEAIQHKSQIYQVGQRVDLPDPDAGLLIALGHAEAVVSPAAKAIAPTTDK